MGAWPLLRGLETHLKMRHRPQSFQNSSNGIFKSFANAFKKSSQNPKIDDNMRSASSQLKKNGLKTRYNGVSRGDKSFAAFWSKERCFQKLAPKQISP